MRRPGGCWSSVRKHSHPEEVPALFPGLVSLEVHVQAGPSSMSYRITVTASVQLFEGVSGVLNSAAALP